MNPDRLDELLCAHQDGALQAQDRAELDALLAADPAQREEYLALARVHLLLAARLGRGGALPLADRIRTLNGGQTTRRQRRLTEQVARSLHTRPRRILRWVALAAALLLAGGASFWWRTRPAGPPTEVTPSLLVTSLKGQVSIDEGSGPRCLLARDPVPVAATYATAKDSHLELRLADGTCCKAGPESSFRLDLGDLRLQRGTLTIETPPRTIGNPLRVESPLARVEVLGTRFQLAAASEADRLQVDAGSVRWIPRQGEARTVTAPEYAETVDQTLCRQRVTELVSEGWRLERGATARPPARWRQGRRWQWSGTGWSTVTSTTVPVLQIVTLISSSTAKRTFALPVGLEAFCIECRVQSATRTGPKPGITLYQVAGFAFLDQRFASATNLHPDRNHPGYGFTVIPRRPPGPSGTWYEYLESIGDVPLVRSLGFGHPDRFEIRLSGTDTVVNLTITDLSLVELLPE